jgi:hypothetical protein
MLVYGDPKRVEEVAAKLSGLREGFQRLGFARPGIERHAAVAELLITAGELEQGLLDEQLSRLGEERWTPLSEAAGLLTRSVAGLLRASWRSGGLRLCSPEKAAAPARRALNALAALDLPATITVTVPEGYAFYGLYPETYLEAARRLDGPVRAIGIRSIGTGLAAVVAAAAGEREPAVSVRPGGHPFSRTLTIGDDLAERLLDGTVRYVVADEGPGLSGSSFGSAADWLEDRGVSPEAISFFPSHRGDLGPYANERHRQRWDRARRHVVDFEDLFADGSRWPLAQWAEDLTGPPEAPPEDLSAGRWRERLVPDRSQWPPAHLQQERRKYLLAAGGRRWLFKFAGLGRYGREKLALAEPLAREGLIPEIVGLRHGFLVGPWLEDAKPLTLEVDRASLLDTIARYLAFRAERFPSGAERRGAGPGKLFEMASYNTGKALGEEAASALEPWRERLARLEEREKPVLTDNRMHAWEWLVLPDGRIVKADALDHHQGNDLVGEQDVAWDLAGAAVELGLTGDELEEVMRKSGVRTSSLQLRFYTLAYIAFQLGYHTFAAEALAGMDAEEAARMRRASERYAIPLRRLTG